MNKSKKGYADNIEQSTLDNKNFREVLYTGKMQLVLMSLQPGEDIGWEVHDDHDQFFRLEEGTAKVTIDEEVHEVKADDSVVVPAGAKHNVENTGEGELKLYTIYAPPEHPDKTIHATKEEAVAAE